MRSKSCRQWRFCLVELFRELLYLGCEHSRCALDKEFANACCVDLHILGQRCTFGFASPQPRLRLLRMAPKSAEMNALVTVCSRHTSVILVEAWMHRSRYALETRTLFWLRHGCTGQRMLSKHERYYGLGMDALVTVCSRNTNVIMVWAWMHRSPYALETRT